MSVGFAITLLLQYEKYNDIQIRLTLIFTAGGTKEPHELELVL
jgi:hypothetical protein